MNIGTLAIGLAVAFAVPRFGPAAETTAAQASAIIVVGTGGAEEYRETFEKWARNWRDACATGNVKTTVLEKTDISEREQWQHALDAEPKEGTETLWLVLLGHGTFDGRDGKFNLRGDDLSAAEMAAWLKPFQRPIVVIAAFSASGAFLAPLAAPGRVVITATRSGTENNFSRFGGYLSEAIANSSADLDHDGQTSLLEAWLSAAQRVADFYQAEGRLATEHSLLEDNADGRGTPPDWFQGIRVVKKTKDNAVPDGLRAHQIHLIPSPAERAFPATVRADRDALELELAKLREAKSTLSEDEYFTQLEPLLIRLARLYRKAGTVEDR